MRYTYNFLFRISRHGEKIKENNGEVMKFSIFALFDGI